MSKTPAWRLLQSIRAAIHAGATTGEPVFELFERRVSRRSVLRTSAAVAASAIASPGFARPRRPATSAPRVAVVGAGLAGLHCAYRLALAGVRVEVYEAARRIGGRVLSDRKTFHPQHCELGAELIDSEHVAMCSLAQELDIKLLDFHTDASELHHMVSHFGRESLTLRELVTEFTPIVARIDAHWNALRDPQGDVTYRSPNGAERLDRLSIAEWLDAEKISGRVRRFLEVAYIVEFGLETSESSAINLLVMLAGSGSRIAQHPDDWSVWGSSDERYHAADGNDQFVHRLADRIGRERIHLGRRLVRICHLPGGRSCVVLTGDGRTIETAVDRVVLAIPFSLLRDVDLSRVPLSPVKRRAIAELGMGRNTKLMCGFSERVWRTRHGAAGMTLTDLPFQCAWDTSRLQTSEHGIMTQYLGGARTEMVPRTQLQQQRREFVDQLEQVYPGVRAAALDTAVRFDWPSYAFTRGSFAAYRVGQWTTLAGSEGEAEGTLHFCGEHTSTTFQGFMEGAAESGARAAAEVMATLNMRGANPSPSSSSNGHQHAIAHARHA